MKYILIFSILLFTSQAGAWEPMPCDTRTRLEQNVEVKKTVPKLWYGVHTYLWIGSNITWAYHDWRVRFEDIDNELALQMREGIKAKAATERLIKKMCKED